MLKPIHPDTPPRGLEWHYVNPEDGFKISHIHLEVLNTEVRKYRHRNNYPIGSNFVNDFLDNACRNTADGASCVDSEPPTLAQKVKKFAQAMAQFASSGFKMASPETVESRKSTCEMCYYYSGSASLLKVGCRRCGCSSVKLYIDSEKCPDGRW